MKRTFINRLTSEMMSYGIEFWIHIVFIIGICLLAAIVLRLSGIGHEAVGMIAGGIGLLAGVLKEVFDKSTGGELSLMDIIADFWGAVLFMLCHFV